MLGLLYLGVPLDEVAARFGLGRVRALQLLDRDCGRDLVRRVAGIGGRGRPRKAGPVVGRPATVRRVPSTGSSSRVAARERREEWRRLRAEQMFARLAEGVTLQVVGDEFGVSRERVRQLLYRQFGADVVREVLAVNRVSRAKPRRERTVRTLSCMVCGREWTTASVRSHGDPDSPFSFCEEHRRFDCQIRTMCDPVRHDKHQRLLFTPRKTSRQWQPDRPRRWLVQGSGMHLLCSEAFANGWPLVGHLPVEIRAQLEREAALPSPPYVRPV